MEQGYRFQAAHEQGYRDAHQKRPRNALNHDESSVSPAVEITDEAEQDGGEHGIDGVGPKIVRRPYHLCIPSEQARQQIPVEERQPCQHHAEAQGGAQAVDDGGDGQKGNAHQHILEGHRSAQAQDAPGVPGIEADVLEENTKGKP